MGSVAKSIGAEARPFFRLAADRSIIFIVRAEIASGGTSTRGSRIGAVRQRFHMEIFCLGVAQVDPLLRIRRNIIPLENRHAPILSRSHFRFRRWHGSKMVGIPTQCQTRILSNPKTLPRRIDLPLPRVEPPNHLSPTCHVVVLTKTGSRGKGGSTFVGCSSRPAGRTHGNRKGHQRCFPSHHRGRRRSFSSNPSLDIEIAVAKTEPTVARSHREFPECQVT